MLTEIQQAAEVAIRAAAEAKQLAESAEAAWIKQADEAKRAIAAEIRAKQYWAEAAAKAVEAAKVSSVAWESWAMEMAKTTEVTIAGLVEKAAKATGIVEDLDGPEQVRSLRSPEKGENLDRYQEDRPVT